MMDGGIAWEIISLKRVVVPQGIMLDNNAKMTSSKSNGYYTLLICHLYQVKVLDVWILKLV